MDIDKIELELHSRDDIPQLIKGLHYIFVTPPRRQEGFAILNGIFPPELNLDNGRPGMDRGSRLVMGVLRLSLNGDYDRLHNVVNNPLTIRQIWGHGQVDDRKPYTLQNLKDKVVLCTPEILDQVNQAVVKAGPELLKKKPQDGQPVLVGKAPEPRLKGRCDSLVVETHVEYPTDTRLLFDAIRKVIEWLMPVGKAVGLLDGQAGQDQLRELKKLWRPWPRLKPSSAKDEAQKEARRQAMVEAHQEYLRVARERWQSAEKTGQERRQKHPESKNKLLKIEECINHAHRPINPTERRVIQGEALPHQDKVFSIFEPPTEWLSQGKAGVPVELGWAACGVEDPYQFIRHQRLMLPEVDVDIAVVMVNETQARFPELSSCSFDQGFHATANQRDWATLLDTGILPKKGRLSTAQQARQQADEFVAGRRQHAAIESALQALEVHGLDRCPDRG